MDRTKKRICFFSGDINRSGGTERVSTVIANSLNDKNYQIYFLSLENGNNPFFEMDKRIKLFSLEMENRNKKIEVLSIIKKIRIFLKTYDIDYIIGIDVISSIFLVPATFLISTKTIAWEHFNYHVKLGNNIQNFERSIGRILSCLFANKIITLTKNDTYEYQKNWFCNKNKVMTIYNPCTIKNTDVSKVNKKNILAVGRLTNVKGFDKLLKVWSLVKKVNKDWTLTIVGDGEDKEKLLNQIKLLNLSESVKIYPTTKNIDEYYINSSIYVMTSRSEGLPLVLIEAKKFALPIVSFNCSYGIKEIVKHNIDGYIIENSNIIEFSEKIIELITNRDKRVLMSKKSLEDKRFEKDLIISKWINILN